MYSYIEIWPRLPYHVVLSESKKIGKSDRKNVKIGKLDRMKKLKSVHP